MSGFQPRDSRGLFMLPQAPEESGYSSTAPQIKAGHNTQMHACFP